MDKIKRIFLGCMFAGFMLTLHANEYIAVNKEGKIYDQANAKYATENQDGDEIAVIPGMVFSASDHTPGWYKIEYSSGLHAFIPDQIIASSFNKVGAGNYKVANNPAETISVKNNGNDWVCIIGDTSYKGTQYGEILIFFDEANKLRYSIADIGNGPVAINYDNAVTKFF